MNALNITESVHANCVLIGDTGVLIRGVSGSGKSTFSRRLVDLAQKIGHFARFVGDDRILLRTSHGRLIASGHPLIAGRVEVRGLGIAVSKFEDQAVIRLLADCEPVLERRVPDPSDDMIEVLGIACRRISVTSDGVDNVLVSLGMSNVLI